MLIDIFNKSEVDTAKRLLMEIMKKKSFKESKDAIYQLASGRMSNFYMNCKPTILDPQGMFLVGALMLHSLIGSEAFAIGGLTFGADPIAVATVYSSFLYNNKPVSSNIPYLRALSVRKEQKDHGIIKWVEGDIPKGSRVAVIDDVVTTGGSTLKAIERLRTDGYIVDWVRVLFDRQEDNGIEKIQDQVTDTKSIITVADIRNAI